jgi:hypothetical protein
MEEIRRGFSQIHADQNRLTKRFVFILNLISVYLRKSAADFFSNVFRTSALCRIAVETSNDSMSPPALKQMVPTIR